MRIYKHTQIGWVVIVGVGGAALVSLATQIAARPSVSHVPVLVALLVGLAMFSTLTVLGSRDELEVRFGIGLIRKRFTWDDIHSARQVRNRWLSGWGIRWSTSGWLFNVSGLDAVELRLKNGKAFRIGTDDPADLHAFIQSKLQQPGAT